MTTQVFYAVASYCLSCTTHSSRHLVYLQSSFFHKLDLPVHGKTVLVALGMNRGLGARGGCGDEGWEMRMEETERRDMGT